MSMNLQHGLELEPAMLAKLVKEDYQKEIMSLVGNADADQILSMFGEEVSNKIRKADLAKLKSSSFQTNNVRNSQSEATEPKEAPIKMNPRDYNEYLKKKFAK